MKAARAAPRPWSGQVVAIAVASTALLALLGGCSDSDPSPAARSSPVATGPSATSTPAGAQIPGGAPQALSEGVQESPIGFTPRLRFRVPLGWYGSGDSAGFGVGQGLDTVNERFGDVGIQIETLTLGISDALAKFQTIPEIVPGPAITRTVAGRASKEFHAKLSGDAVGLEQLDSTGDINEFTDAQIFVDLGGGQTLLIRTEIVTAAAKPALVSVLDSLELAE